MPRILTNPKRMTFQEYLDLEKYAEIRHGFVDSFIFAMAVANNTHSVISGNIFLKVGNAARAATCRAYINDMKLRTPEPDSSSYYPDVFVTYDVDDLNTDIKTTACFIIEVLSTSTGDIDRGEKWQNYRKLSSLQAYVLVSQKHKYVEIYRRMADGSWRYEVLENERVLKLPCINASMTLNEIYEDVDFSNNEATLSS
ncbi:MAG: Uma2 family endonuclease [Trueperaceae bacterium]